MVGNVVDGEEGSQEVALDEWGCLYDDLIVHEAMHALGFFHEHQRPDRDAYVKVNWDNIVDGSLT